MNKELLESTRAFVKNIYEESPVKSLYYHNWEHTERVCNSATEIAENVEEVTDDDKEVLTLAILFHDVAYTIRSRDHEKNGADMAAEYLTNAEYDPAKIEIVKRLILATKLGHKPVDKLEEIILDADNNHIGREDYLTTTYVQLYEEIDETSELGMSKKKWAKESIAFFDQHEFYTDYAKTKYESQKALNYDKISKIASGSGEKIAGLEGNKSEKKKKKKKKGSKEKNLSDPPEKGVETMFRVALRNHINLSRLADMKANTLISVNAIIISIAISTLLPKLDSNPYLIYPGLGLIIFGIITIIISILSTIPKTTHGNLSRKEVEEKKGNLIFFGNFHKMSLEDYEWSIGELMKDRDYLYKSLTRDLYFLGKVLNRKYNLLRWSYYTFVLGLIITIGLSIWSIQMN